MKFFLRLVASILTWLAACGAVVAADVYPAKTVRIVVAFAAGGSTDLLARSVAQRLNEAWKQPVIVDNRAGGGGIVGSDYVAKAPADGYTLLLGTNTTNAVAASLYAKLPFDPQRDFAPITEIATIPQMLSVHPSIPAKSLKELVALAKAHPNELNYGTAGTGSTSHMAMELFQSVAKIKMVHVPYKGTGPGDDRTAGRPSVADVRRHHDFAAARAVGQAAHARGEQPATLADRAAGADRRRVGLSGLRGDRMVRLVRARRRAARCHPQGERGNRAR